MNATVELGSWDLMRGDCLEKLQELPDNSVDAVVTDPPYGLSALSPAQISEVMVKWASGDRTAMPVGKGFLSNSWDVFVPPPAVWDECLRVLKPGGYLVAFSGDRTQHLMGLSITLAGFEIRSMAIWANGSGMPKGQDVSLAIDTGTDVALCSCGQDVAQWIRKDHDVSDVLPDVCSSCGVQLSTDGVTVVPAKQLREVTGSGTSGAGFHNNKGFGLGKIGTGIATTKWELTAPYSDQARKWEGFHTMLKPALEPITIARKPVSESTSVANVLAHGTGAFNIDVNRMDTSESTKKRGGSTWRDDKGRFPTNLLVDDHFSAVLEEQSAGSSEYFPVFYHPKATAAERPVITREDGTQVLHQTVKPVDVMKWLVRLVCPPGGTVLDPFAGSGTTLQAAVEEGFDVIGCEMTEDYWDLIEARMKASATGELMNTVNVKKPELVDDEMGLF